VKEARSGSSRGLRSVPLATSQSVAQRPTRPRAELIAGPREPARSERADHDLERQEPDSCGRCRPRLPSRMGASCSGPHRRRARIQVRRLAAEGQPAAHRSQSRHTFSLMPRPSLAARCSSRRRTSNTTDATERTTRSDRYRLQGLGDETPRAAHRCPHNSIALSIEGKPRSSMRNLLHRPGPGDLDLGDFPAQDALRASDRGQPALLRAVTLASHAPGLGWIDSPG